MLARKRARSWDKFPQLAASRAEGSWRMSVRLKLRAFLQTVGEKGISYLHGTYIS